MDFSSQGFWGIDDCPDRLFISRPRQAQGQRGTEVSRFHLSGGLQPSRRHLVDGWKRHRCLGRLRGAGDRRCHVHRRPDEARFGNQYRWLSYEPGNTAAKAMYARMDFRENGETDGDEVVAVLPLS